MAMWSHQQLDFVPIAVVQYQMPSDSSVDAGVAPAPPRMAFVGPPRDNRESGASTKILQRLGFKLFADAQDPDAGDVWEWRT